MFPAVKPFTVQNYTDLLDSNTKAAKVIDH